MTRVLLVGGSDDGTTVERDGDIYGERLIDGYSEVGIWGIPDHGHKWSREELAMVPVALALNVGLPTTTEVVAAGGPPIVPENVHTAVFAAFDKWAAAQ